MHRDLLSRCSASSASVPKLAILAPERILQCHAHFPHVRLIHLVRKREPSRQLLVDVCAHIGIPWLP